MKMAGFVATALFRTLIFAAKNWLVAQTRNEDLLWRVCGILLS
jgi:hypothetical protein